MHHNNTKDFDMYYATMFLDMPCYVWTMVLSWCVLASHPPSNA